MLVVYRGIKKPRWQGRPGFLGRLNASPSNNYWLTYIFITATSACTEPFGAIVSITLGEVAPQTRVFVI